MLPDGRRTQRSTKTKSSSLARALAMKWESAARRRVTEAQARRVISDIVEDIHGTRVDCPELSAYVAQWLQRKEGETAAPTLWSYRRATEDFATFLGERSRQPLHYVTPAQVAAWRDANAARATPRTANNKLKVLRAMFQTAWRDGIIAENPAAKVQALKTAESRRRPFKFEEVRAVLRVANNEWRGMVLAGFYTGQRLKDIASLTWANVDVARNELRLTTSKTGRHQIIPIAKPLLGYLLDLPTNDNPKSPIFPNIYCHGIRPGGSSKLSQQFYEILVSAGLVSARPPKHKAKGIGRSAGREQSEISFHSLRHTLTSVLKEHGTPESVARDIIGHESAEISRHYTHTSEDSKRLALEKLPDLTLES